jgi:hypothetical protein
MTGQREAPAPVLQCWCHALYDQFRAAIRPGGLCLTCALLPGMCEAGHRMIADNPELAALDRQQTGRQP